MEHRLLTEKVRKSRELAILFGEMLRKTGRDIETLSGNVRVPVGKLKQIAEGDAHKLNRETLLRVFEFLPIEDSEAKSQTSRLINTVSVPSREGRIVCYRQR